MKHTRTALALLAGTLLLTACTTYDDHVQQCAKAVKARATGDKTKPAACKPLKEDDYTLVVMSHTVDELGWTDENGNFDPNKMLQSTPSP